MYELKKESCNRLKIVLSVEEEVSVFIVEIFPNGAISFPGVLENIITASLPRSHHFGRILDLFLTGLPVELPALLSDPVEFP